MNRCLPAPDMYCCSLRVNGPIFPDDPQSGGTTDSEFFRLKPSQFTNGCFVARLSRQVRETGCVGCVTSEKNVKSCETEMEWNRKLVVCV